MASKVNQILRKRNGNRDCDRRIGTGIEAGGGYLFPILTSLPAAGPISALTAQVLNFW